MHGLQESRLTAPTGAGSDDVSGATFSETAAAYLDARLAQGLVTPASAHDHSTVNDPGATAD